ncbi:TATA box-binding protein-associated factor RNA polymerase I subunit C isoform X2 [Cyclopterus lumpus]|uniref:TATA box-binding protein-associated factor RNA polymerase I subunit C isoform X2 n=1 Tax=Cyclopterus lumpus TaxID=8103 RepID=UPI001485E7BE|nr:TATA box-binding protein-associated factor RNA polymerase I subunit C isoform X2 [Cyclopterus lumpus]
MTESYLRAARVPSPAGRLHPDTRPQGRRGVTRSRYQFPSCRLKTMQNFFLDHCKDAFGCMAEILGETFEQAQKERVGRQSVYDVRSDLDMKKFKMSPLSYSSKSLHAYSALLSDVVPAVPVELLGSLLHEELTEQRDRSLFSEGATGGALAFIPFPRGGGDPQRGCLLYPGNQGLDCLNFHRVEMQHRRGSSSCVDAGSSDPFRFQLKGPVRQISCASLFDDCCVAVRSDRLCGIWRIGEQSAPRLLQVVDTREVATCVSASPHVLGEVLVVTESGAANLWSVGRGMQKVREEDVNLYFNAKSSWRWCEFSAHPRVMTYADRTGVELTDVRESPVLSHTLFHISNTPECRSGERLILSRYLGDVHTFQHLVTTQYSAYIMDERFPCLPMLKWDHMMLSPPMFCHAVCGSTSPGSAVGGVRTTKVLLGSQTSQEITLLQYSGGRAEASSSRGPLQALLRPRDSLKHLPVQIPHRLDLSTSRLSSPAAGLTCIQKTGGRGDGEECICILQLTEAGDIFYQTLEPEQQDASKSPAAEDEPALKEATTSGGETARRLRLPQSQPVISDTSSDEGVIGPTQDAAVPVFVTETPEKEWQALDVYSDSSSEGPEPRGRSHFLKQYGLRVVVNGEPDQVSGSSPGLKSGERVGDNFEEPGGGGGLDCAAGPTEQTAPVKLSVGAIATWKRWLQKSCGKMPRPCCPQHLTVKTVDLLLSDKDARDPTEEERVRSLRRNLRACMSKRSLLVHGAISAPLQAPSVVVVPDAVDTEAWRDEVSHRLTLAWQGEGAWRAWWEERLGLNREEKVKALRRKRKREKEAKRATGQRLELSGSFTSSISYQSELSDFSDSTGRSSTADRWASSDTDGNLSQTEGFWESEKLRATTPTTPSATRTHTPVATPTGAELERGNQQTLSSALDLSQTPNRESAPVNQRRPKRPAEDYISALFAPQDDPSQPNSYFLEEEESTPHHPALPPPVTPSSFQWSLRMDLPQNASLRSCLSQSSQGRQASQLKKKKSRMGF